MNGESGTWRRARRIEPFYTKTLTVIIGAILRFKDSVASAGPKIHRFFYRLEFVWYYYETQLFFRFETFYVLINCKVRTIRF